MINLNELIQHTVNGSGDSNRHVLTLFSLILQNKSKNILELGVRSGVTTIPMYEAARIIESTITSVDINYPIFDYVKLENEYNKFKFIKSDALKFLEDEVRQNKYYDFIFIDDWHDGFHVQKELELIDKLVDNKSIITLHDLMANSEPEYNLVDWGDPNSGKPAAFGEFANGGPYYAVNSLDKEKWEWCTIPVNNGLTVLRKK